MIALLAVVAIIAYLLVAQAVIGAVVLSAVRNRTVPLYWAVAGISALAAPFALWQPLPVRGNSDSATYSYLLEGAFSQYNLICLVGAVVAFGLSFPRAAAFRVVSGASWAFLSAYTVRVVGLTVGGHA